MEWKKLIIFLRIHDFSIYKNIKGEHYKSFVIITWNVFQRNTPTHNNNFFFENRNTKVLKIIVINKVIP